MTDPLSRINSPADLKGLDINGLRLLCEQTREYMIECCAVHPGHLGSSLGAVELIVGLHYVFDTPDDRLIFDVSHQTYAHKILTGRREAFRTLRQADGISGFTRMDESPYDAFGGGHSSTSISAALGIADALKLQGKSDRVVALIGDGSLSGGLAFEGLNNAGDSDTDILVIINDNNISIDRNIGAVHEHLLHLTTSPFYNTMKSRIWDFLGNGKFRKWVQNNIIRLKSNLVQRSGGDLFEAMGFRYFGPIDGNDIEAVTDTLARLKDLHGPRILHTITKKGKGYAPAEKSQTIWHSPGQFDPASGKRLIKSRGTLWQDAFGEILLSLAKQDAGIVGITPAMASGCGMSLLAHEMPERFFDVGIAEEHAVTFSAGLAAAGMKPFCNIYSSFAQRAYDQIIHDVALQGLPVTLCLDRAGLVGEDGATHNGAFDLCSLRCIPGCTIAVPRNEIQLHNMMYSASLSSEGPYVIRYPRGKAEGAQWKEMAPEKLVPGKGELLREGEDIAIIGLGQYVNRAVEAADRFASEYACKGPAVWDAVFLKPFDNSIMEELTSGRFHSIITIEDGAVKGGLFSEIAEAVAGKGLPLRVVPVGIPDTFIHQDTQERQREECGLSADKIYQKILQIKK